MATHCSPREWYKCRDKFLQYDQKSPIIIICISHYHKYTYAEVAKVLEEYKWPEIPLFMRKQTNTGTQTEWRIDDILRPAHPIIVAQDPASPRLGPPNLTQGVNNNLNFN